MKQNLKPQLTITTCKGRLLTTYPGQTQAQGRYIEVFANGKLHISWNAEIGNAVPVRVWNNVTRRIHGNWTTKQEAREFIANHRADFLTLVNGMGEKWDGSNAVGTLTPEASVALEKIEYAAYNEQ